MIDAPTTTTLTSTTRSGTGIAPESEAIPVPERVDGAIVTASAALVALVGCAALADRDWALRTGDPTVALVALFVAIGVAGALWPLPAPRPGVRIATSHLGVLAVGVGAFAVGRLIGGGEAFVALSFGVLARNTLAAVAEEALFRRLLYGAAHALAGPVTAIAISSAAFALVHVPAYGWWVAPIDLAAGLVLGWQRWVTGSFVIPAATHAAANLLVVL